MKEFKTKPLKGLEDLGDKKYSIQQLNRVNNGYISPITNHATSESRSKGGLTNKKTGHISNLGKQHGSRIGKKYGPENAKKYLRTPEVITKQVQSASIVISQLTPDGMLVNTFVGSKSFLDTEFTYNTVRNACRTGKLYNGFIWKIEKQSDKNHKKSSWTPESIMEVAKECTYKAEFKQKYQQAYHFAKKFGIFEEVTKHMVRPKAKNQYTK